MTRELVTIIIMAVLLIGCTTMKRVDPQQTDLAEFIEVGDRLIVYTRNSGNMAMTVTDIDDKVIRSNNVTVKIDDIVRVEVEKIDGAKTTLAIVGAAGGVYIILRGLAEAANSQIHW